MDYGIVIEKIHQELKAYWGKGKVADYIPALAEVEPKRYGIAIETLDGHSFQVGDADIRFSIQSISKVLALAIVSGSSSDVSLRGTLLIRLYSWNMNMVFRVILLSMPGLWWSPIV